MIKMNLRFNGRKITSSAQLQREMSKSFEKAIDKGIRKAAGPSIKLKKTRARDGYLAEGASTDIERMTKRLR